MSSSQIIRVRLRPYASTEHRSLEIIFHVEREGDRSLRFLFEIAGDLSAVRWSESEAIRRDEIWKSTCFELFLSRPGSQAYLEINLSNRDEWNVYRFDSYRKGMRPYTLQESPFESFNTDDKQRARLEGAVRARSRFEAREDALFLQELLEGPVEISATAVIESSKTGEREYWALAHVGQKPDFHLRDSFTVEV